MNIFRNGHITRLDFALYSAGRMESVYVDNFAQPGITFYLTSMRRAPWRFDLLHEAGRFAQPPSVPQLFFTGSRSEPYASWRFRLGRYFIGGYTPRWVLRLCEHMVYRMAVRQAKLERAEDLCPKCRDGLLEWVPGYPGEEFFMCRRCHHVADHSFDRSAVE